jgi:hypothetical protein
MSVKVQLKIMNNVDIIDEKRSNGYKRMHMDFNEE